MRQIINYRTHEHPGYHIMRVCQVGLVTVFKVLVMTYLNLLTMTCLETDIYCKLYSYTK